MGWRTILDRMAVEYGTGGLQNTELDMQEEMMKPAEIGIAFSGPRSVPDHGGGRRK